MHFVNKWSSWFFFRFVALVLLKSQASNPVAPEELRELRMSPPSENEDNVAFVARNFSITEFQNDTIKIVLQKYNSRRKRDIEIAALSPGGTYRAAQVNTDETGVG